MIQGVYTLQHIRDGEVVGEYDFHNGIVDEGMEYLLDVGFYTSGTKETNWYVGLVDNSAFSSFANSDVMSSHAGWTEFTSYTESNRPEWVAGAASSRAVTNASTVDFSVNASGTLKGIFIVSDNTKGGTSGVLWSTAAFASTINVSNGDTFKITYSISG